jgi:hypothetical protein
MMNKTKLALAMLLLLQIAPAASAAGRQHLNSRGALSAYDYARAAYGWIGGPYPFDYTAGSRAGPLRNDPAYDYARAVYGWIAGPYPFDYTPGSHPRPLRSGGRCWVNTGGGQLGWGPC